MIKARSRSAYQKAIIAEYLDNNLKKFLRKHWKQSLNELVYSTYLRKWKKTNKRLYYSLINNVIIPKRVCGIVNVMITLNKHYGYEMDNDCAKISKLIFDNFDMEIWDKVKEEVTSQGFPNLDDLTVGNKRKAFKEQKARGFIHINDFEDYNRDYAYLFSNVDKDFILPIPFYHNFKEWVTGMRYCYHGQFLYGVSGWTRIQLPGKGGMAI